MQYSLKKRENQMKNTQKIRKFQKKKEENKHVYPTKAIHLCIKKYIS